MRRVSSRALAVAVAWGALGAAGHAQQVAFDQIVKQLQHSDARARRAAVELLRDTGRPEAIAPLATTLRDPVADVKRAALDAVLSLYLADPVNVRRRVALIVEVRGGTRAGTAFELGPTVLLPLAVPPELVTGLLAAIQDEDARLRADAIHVFGALMRPPHGLAGADALTEGLMFPDPGVRAAAAAVLGRQQIVGAGEALVFALNDPDTDVRTAAMRALGDLREARAVQALTEQFQFYGRTGLALAALDGLARIAHGSSVPLFSSLVRDRNAQVRRIAYEGIGRAGDLALVPTLEGIIGSESNPAAALGLAFGLQKLGRPHMGTLVQGLARPRHEARARAYLIELGAAVAPALHTYLHDATPAIRRHVAAITGVVGAEDSIAALDPLRADPDPAVALAAERAIQRIRVRSGPAPRPS
jgi:HEAT repeat protein